MGYLSYAIAMTSPADTKQGFDMLSKAITQIDAEICGNSKVMSFPKIQNILPILKYCPRQAFLQKKTNSLFKKSRANLWRIYYSLSSWYSSFSTRRSHYKTNYEANCCITKSKYFISRLS